MSKINTTHLDAAESVFFERELEHVKARTYDKKYDQFNHREILPVSYEADPADEVIIHESYEQVGIAKIISDYADDLPRSDVLARSFSTPIKSIGGSYGYSIQEIRRSMRAGKGLPERKATATRRSMMTEEERIAWFGDADTGLQGFFNNPNITVVAAAGKAAGGTTWAVATVEEILADIRALMNIPIVVTNGHERIQTILMPDLQYGLLATTQMNNVTNQTVLQFVMENFKALGLQEIIPLFHLRAAGVAGVSRMIGYRKDPEYLTLEIPQDFEQFPPQQRNLEFVVPCHQRHGGVRVYYPLAFASMDGI